MPHQGILLPTTASTTLYDSLIPCPSPKTSGAQTPVPLDAPSPALMVHSTPACTVRACLDSRHQRGLFQSLIRSGMAQGRALGALPKMLWFTISRRTFIINLHLPLIVHRSHVWLLQGKWVGVG